MVSHINTLFVFWIAIFLVFIVDRDLSGCKMYVKRGQKTSQCKLLSDPAHVRNDLDTNTSTARTSYILNNLSNTNFYISFADNQYFAVEVIDGIFLYREVHHFVYMLVLIYRV